MYTLSHLLLLDPILKCALISASLISAPVKAWVFWTRSLLPKLKQLKVCVHSSNPDVLVITETWLRKSVLNTDVNLSGYNLFQQDRSKVGEWQSLPRITFSAQLSPPSLSPNNSICWF